MIAIFLSGMGLILGIYGCFLTVRKALLDVYNTKVMFDLLWEENQKLFRRKDRVIQRIARVLFVKYLNKQQDLPPNVRTLREGNEVVIGFVLILIGFLSQLSGVIIVLVKGSS